VNLKNCLYRLFKRAALIAAAIALIVTASHSPASAINYYTGGRLPEGFYLNLYPYWFTADRRTDRNGNVVTDNLGMDKYGVFFSGCYYKGDLLLNVVVPVGRLEIDAANDSNAGFGDIQLRAGYFLPVKWVTILPAIAVKAPTGAFEKNRKVNLGDGQTDLLAEVYINKLFDRFSVDWLFKYSRRLYNHDTDIKSGDEFITEGLVTYKITDTVRFGPSVAFLIGDDINSHGKTVKESGQLKLSCGGELNYRGFQKAKLSVAVLKDVYTRNTAEGVLTLGRITIPF